MLPKVVTTTFLLTLPSSKQKVRFRPFLVKEEKVLLMAVQAQDETSTIDAIKQVIAACVTDPDTDTPVDVGKLPYFDVEYLFLNIRAKSLGEIIKVDYRHTGGINFKNEPCEVVTSIDINLEQVKVETDPGHTNKVMIDDNLGIEFRYPTIDDIKQISAGTNEIDLIAKCIVSVFDKNEAHFPDNLAQSVEFIESLNSQQFAKIGQFVATMPKLRHKFTYACKCGQSDEVVLEGISDFF